FGGDNPAHVATLSARYLQPFQGQLQRYPIGRKGYNGRVERSHRTDDKEFYAPYLQVHDTQQFLALSYRWLYVYNVLRSHLDAGMEGMPPLAALCHLGYTGDEHIALLPPILLAPISTDLLVAGDKRTGNDLLANYEKNGYISAMTNLLLATDNAGKIREYEQLLESLQIKLWTPRELGLALAVHEDGASYVENARIKALAYMQTSGMPTLADDSGLEVDALSGAPGIHSARYAGYEADDADRYYLLLQQLEGLPWEKRTARFRCVLVLATTVGEIYSTEGVCEGFIGFEPQGSHGFGYDPIFFLPEYGQTMAQLSPEIKNRISHRARAVQKMLPILSRILAGSTFSQGG
ncbi:MAG: RdgB/HAM1 family non-canonical purine NTP pyrophosphatase, partial [Anaerolineae bacterium]